jgi:hypothetical protein
MSNSERLEELLHEAYALGIAEDVHNGAKEMIQRGVDMYIAYEETFKALAVEYNS